MVDYAHDLRASGIYISDIIICLLCHQVLLEEYNVFRQIIARKGGLLTIDGLMDELRARYDLSKKVSSRPSDTAFVGSGLRRRESEQAGVKCKNMMKKQYSRSGDDLAVSAIASEKEEVRFSPAFSKKQGTSGSSALNWSAASVVKPKMTPTITSR